MPTRMTGPAGDLGDVHSIGPSLQVFLLGPLEVRIDGRQIDLGGSKQRALLAILLLRANRPVPIELIIDDLWDEPPQTAAKSVQVYVSRLRRLLGDAANRIETTSSGYRFVADPNEIDADRFRALTALGRAALPTDPMTAAATLREALELWHGAPVADLASEPFAQVAAPPLEELRLVAVEARIDADLALGRSGELVGELQDLVRAHPFREHFGAQLMLSLYRAGRQAEALDAYEDARRRFVDELGIDPGPDLRRLQSDILQQSPSLDLTGGDTPRPEVNASLPSAAGTGSSRPRTEQKRHAHRRRRLVLVAAAIVVAAVVASILVAVDGGSSVGGGVMVRPNSVALVDPTGNRVVGDIAVGTRPGPIVVSGPAAWVANVGDRTISRIDLRTHVVVKTFGLSQSPLGLAGGPGVVWITDGFDGTLSRIITSYDQLSAPFFPGPSVQGLVAIAASSSDLWAGLGNRTFLDLDARSLHVKASIRLPGRVKAIALMDGEVWTIQFYDDDVRAIDSATDEVVRTIALPSQPSSIVAGNGAVWIATADARLWKIDPATGRIEASAPIGVTPSAMLVEGQAMWIAGGGVLERIDPRTDDLVRTLQLGRPIGGLAAVDGKVWVTVG